MTNAGFSINNIKLQKDKIAIQKKEKLSINNKACYAICSIQGGDEKRRMRKGMFYFFTSED